MQWFKRFFEMAVSEKGIYDAAAQRAKGKGGKEYNAAYGRRGGAAATASSNTSAEPAAVSAPPPRPRSSIGAPPPKVASFSPVLVSTYVSV